jgi:hypothetical protein
MRLVVHTRRETYLRQSLVTEGGNIDACAALASGGSHICFGPTKAADYVANGSCKFRRRSDAVPIRGNGWDEAKDHFAGNVFPSLSTQVSGSWPVPIISIVQGACLQPS